MLTSTKKFWIIAIVCGLLASGLFFQYLQQLKAQYQTVKTVEVVVAAETIPANTVIEAKQLSTIEVPVQYAHANSMKNLDEVTGQVAITTIAKDEVILQDRLLSSNMQEAAFAYKIDDGWRASSIGVDSVGGVGGYIDIGDHVDIIGLFELKVYDATGGERTVQYSTVLVQDRQVLAVGDKSTSAKGAATEGLTTLTLQLSLAEAQKIALVSEYGKVRAVLRSPIDEGTETRPPVQPSDLLKY